MQSQESLRGCIPQCWIMLLREPKIGLTRNDEIVMFSDIHRSTAHRRTTPSVIGQHRPAVQAYNN